MSLNLRIGIGIDAHNLVKNRKLILGGIEIKYSLGLLGHSDADVICHAIADALLGAAGLNDIGYYFPDTDEKLKGISSLKILSKVLTMIKKDGYQIINIDSVIICQEPKLNPYFPKMKANLASVLKVNQSQIGLKAKTTEGIKFPKFDPSIACISVALLAKKTKN
ncbi:MAG: 2-C-methyl-D-erythritol 2,4-cyclodiphosphate synthase [candidate division WOR-3 bacterium]